MKTGKPLGIFWEIKKLRGGMYQSCSLILLIGAIALVLLMTYQHTDVCEDSPLDPQGAKLLPEHLMVYGQEQKNACNPLLPAWDRLPGKPLWPYESIGDHAPPTTFQVRSMDAGRALGKSVQEAREAAERRFAIEIPAPGEVLGLPPEGHLWRPSYEGVPVAFSEENLTEPYQPAPRLWAQDLNELHERWWRKPRDNLVEPMHARQAWVQLALEGVATSRKDPYTRLLQMPKEVKEPQEKQRQAQEPSETD